MKVLLQQDVEKLGSAGEVVDVKPGYGRNYLIPKNLAVVATEGVIRHYHHVKRQAELMADLSVEAAKELADQLSTTSVTIPVTVGEDDKIHGTVTNIQVAEALEERGFIIDRRKISVDQEIRTLGEFTATVDLLADLKPQVKIWVVKEDQA